MKKIIKVLTILCILFSIIACGSVNNRIRQENVISAYQQMMYSSYNMGITHAQLDSICNAENLSNNFNDWLNGYFIDYETHDTTYKHTFIKQMNDRQEILFIVTEKHDSLTISKRIKK